MKDTYAQLFLRFYYAQNASPIFVNPLANDERGEIVFPMNNELFHQPGDSMKTPLVKCLYLKKVGNEYGLGRADINMDIFYRENGRLNGFFNDPQSISEAEFIDRKSTRLNSSHVAISYAVFC